MEEISRVLSRGAMLDIVSDICGGTQLVPEVLDDATFVDELDSIQIVELVFSLSELLPLDRRAEFEDSAMAASTLEQVLQFHTISSLR